MAEKTTTNGSALRRGWSRAPSTRWRGPKVPHYPFNGDRFSRL